MNRVSGVFWCLLVLLSPLACRGEGSPANAWNYYRQGVDCYNKGDYAAATDNFTKSLNTDDRTLEQWSSYNLGLTFYQQAHSVEAQNPADAMNYYQAAREHFRRVLNIDHRDRDAKYNYELTAKKIKELEARMPQNKQQPGGQNKKDSGQNQSKPGEPSQDAQSEKNKGQDQPQQGKKKEEKPAAADQQDQKQATAGKDQPGQQKMSKEEATMLLNNYQRSDEKPKALITQEKQGKPKEIDKDW